MVVRSLPGTRQPRVESRATHAERIAVRKIRDMDLPELARAQRGASFRVCVLILAWGVFTSTHPSTGEPAPPTVAPPATAAVALLAVASLLFARWMPRASGTPVERARVAVHRHFGSLVFGGAAAFIGFLWTALGVARVVWLAPALGCTLLVALKVRADRYFSALQSEAADAAFEAGEF